MTGFPAATRHEKSEKGRVPEAPGNAPRCRERSVSRDENFWQPPSWCDLVRTRHKKASSAFSGIRSVPLLQKSAFALRSVSIRHASRRNAWPQGRFSTLQREGMLSALSSCVKHVVLFCRSSCSFIAGAECGPGQCEIRHCLAFSGLSHGGCCTIWPSPPSAPPRRRLCKTIGERL